MPKTLAEQALPAVDDLLKLDTDALYLELGKRVQALSIDPRVAGSLTPELPETLGVLDDVRVFGKDFFKNVNQQAYALICGGDPAGESARKAVVDAISEGASQVAAQLAGLLVSRLGIAPAIATPVSALVVKQFLKASYETTCKAWKKGQPATTTRAARIQPATT